MRYGFLEKEWIWPALASPGEIFSGPEFPPEPIQNQENFLHIEENENGSDSEYDEERPNLMHILNNNNNLIEFFHNLQDKPT